MVRSVELFEATFAAVGSLAFGAFGFVKPKCETIGFDGSNQTFSFKPPDETLGLTELTLKLETGPQAEELWQQLKEVTVCKNVARKEACELIELLP